MSRQNHPAHVCDFSCGLYEVKSPSGKQGLLFEDSDIFGPSKTHPRTAALSEISPRLVWFWLWYPGWRAMGRPTTGKMSSPIGDIHRARTALTAPSMKENEDETRG